MGKFKGWKLVTTKSEYDGSIIYTYISDNGKGLVDVTAYSAFDGYIYTTVSTPQGEVVLYKGNNFEEARLKQKIYISKHRGN